MTRSSRVPDGVPLKVTVEIPRRARIEVDLRDNPDCLPFGLNLTEATARRRPCWA